MSSVIEGAISWAVAIANDDSHGYSQDSKKRWGSPDYDCSSFVVSAFRVGGGLTNLNATFTGDMKSDFLANGFKEVSISDRKRGDVLLNHNSKSQHTAIYLGNNQIVHASSSETGGKYGKDGDQTGKEICIRSYYGTWDTVLRYVDSDSQEGVQTVNIELPVLREGSKGEEVKTVQRLLNEMNYRDQNGNRLEVDGSFAGKTNFAIRQFQNDYRGKYGRLTVDGIIGANTWKALLS